MFQFIFNALILRDAMPLILLAFVEEKVFSDVVDFAP